MKNKQKKYYIEIIYDTGDSSRHETDVVGRVEEIEWDNIEVAEKNLEFIEQHYKWICDKKYESRFYRTNNQLKNIDKKAKNEPWYRKDYPEVSILLYNDKLELVPVSTFWCCYFETLRSAEIKLNNEIENKRKNNLKC